MPAVVIAGSAVMLFTRRDVARAGRTAGKRSARQLAVDSLQSAPGTGICRHESTTQVIDPWSERETACSAPEGAGAGSALPRRSA